MPKDKTRKPRHTDAQVIAALQQSGGIMAHAARKLGLERSTLHKRVHESAKIKAAMDEAKETNLDVAESKLMKAVNEGQLPAIFFFLKCIGKHRGYVERQEHELVDKPMPAKVVFTAYDASTVPIPQGDADDE